MNTTNGKKRRTTDTYTGRSFTWDHVVIFRNVRVPARSSDGAWLHPDRTPPSLLHKLNS